MKISAKSRYALACLIHMGSQVDEGPITLAALSDDLDISKIYLEQVFALLKRGDIVTSTKGARGGYQLARPARDISAFDVLATIETTLFEKAGATVADKAPGVEHVLQADIFDQLDATIMTQLKSMTLDTLISKAAHHSNDGYMYYL